MIPTIAVAIGGAIGSVARLVCLFIKFKKNSFNKENLDVLN